MSCQSASLIDLNELPPDIRDRIERELKWELDRRAERQRWQELCDNGTEQEIIDAAQALYVECPPITLANRYKHVSPWQEVVAFHIWRHPRRPVLMKGAKGCLIARFGWSDSQCPNGWAFQVAKRYIRAKRLTALTPADAFDFLEPLRLELARRYHTTYHFDKAFPSFLVGLDRHSSDSACAYIGGKRTYMGAAQYTHILALHRIARKFETLEARKEAVREQLMERLAA